MNNPTLRTSGLHFSYGTTPILREIETAFIPGSFHGVIGPNGSGKSTLLDCLAGHKTPTSGTVSLDAESIHQLPAATLARRISMVPQEFLFNFPFTVFEAVLMGRHAHIPRFGRPDEADLTMVEQAMKTMDLTHLARRRLSDLSGGERQRTVVARSLAQDTPILLLDEPTSSMDIRHALTTMSRLHELAREGRTVVAVLHDLNLAATYCDSVTILKDGRIHSQGEISSTLTAATIDTVFEVEAHITRASDNGQLIAFRPRKND